MLNKRRPTRSSALLTPQHKLTNTKSIQHLTPNKYQPFTFRKHIPKTHAQHKPTKSTFQLIVPSHKLFNMLKTYPLKTTNIINQIATNQEITHAVILSSIEQFSQYYSQLLKQRGQQCDKLEWILICRAVNSMQLQKQLNRRYQAFNFILLPSLLSAINRINGILMSDVGVSLQYFIRIVNWQSYDNCNAVIMQQMLQNIHKYEAKDKQLWIISQCNIKHLPQQITLKYYFIDQFSVQKTQIKIVTQAKQTIVYVIVPNSNKITQLLNTIQHSDTILKRNLLTANQTYLNKLTKQHKYIPIYCLINFPPHLLHQFTSNNYYFTTANQPYQLNQLNVSYIYYGFTQQPSYRVVQFNSSGAIKEEMERAILQCQEWKHIYKQYQQLKTNIIAYQIAVLQLQSIQKQLQYFLSSKITLIEQMRSLFKPTNHQIILIGKLSKIQLDCLRNQTHLTIINIIKHTHTYPHNTHQHIINLIQHALQQPVISSSQLKTVTISQSHTTSQQQLNCKPKSTKTLSNIASTISYAHTQTRSYSSPNLIQPNHIYIAVSRTVPSHSLINRSTAGCSLLVYGSVNQLIQLSKYIDQNTNLYIITQVKQLKSLTKDYSNILVVFVEQMSQTSLRQQIDKIIVSQCLQMKRGRMIKSKKSAPAVIIYDQTIPQHNQFINTIQSTFPPHKSSPILITNNLYQQLISNYTTCQLTIYSLTPTQQHSSTRINKLIDLFLIYMSPIHSHPPQINPSHLRFSHKLLYIRHTQQSNKNNRLGRLNQLSNNRVQSPRTRSFKKIDLYTPQKGITIIHSTLSIKKIAKSVQFNSKQHLIGLLFNQNTKGNHSVIAITQSQYHQLIHLCNMKTQGIIWIVVTNNLHLCLVRQPTLIFCLFNQVQSVVMGVGEKYRSMRKRQFIVMRQLSVFDIAENGNAIRVYLYQKWKDYLHQKQAAYIGQSINIIKQAQIDVMGIDDLEHALFCDEQSLNSTILRNQTISTVQQNSYQSKQTIFILCHNQHQLLIKQTLQLIKQTLRLIKQDQFILVVFNHIQDILKYMQIYRTITVISAHYQIRTNNCLQIEQKQIPITFAHKLAAFIQSLRSH